MAAFSLTKRPMAAALSDVFKRMRRDLGAVVVFSLGVNVLMLTMPLYSLQLFDRVLSSHSVSTLWMLTIIALFCLAVMGVLTAFRQGMLARMGQKLEALLSETVLMGGMRMTVFDAKPASAQPLRDLQTLKNFVSGQEPVQLLDAPWAPLYLAVIFMFNPSLGWVAVIGMLVIIAVAVLTDYLTRSQMLTANDATVKALSLAETMARQAEVILSMGMLGALKRRWVLDNAQAQIDADSAQVVANGLANFGRILRLLLQVAIMIVAVLHVLSNDITPGAMIVANILMGRILAPIEGILGTWKNMMNARASLDRINDLCSSVALSATPMDLPPPQGRLSVEGVSHHVRTLPRPILRGVTFQLAAGETMGVVGPSGAGKSTLGRALVGVLKQTSGVVRLDGADVRNWDPDKLGPYIGYLPQDVALFPGTIRENIGRMDPDAPAEKVIKAAQMAGLHEFILRLPFGYDTKLFGEDGVMLSGGQRQRVGLARALYGDPTFLVLDEPNSNLDAEGERALTEAVMRAKSQGATVVVIAHRPSILNNVDKVLVMRDGAVDVFGPASEILPKISGAHPAPKPRVVASKPDAAAGKPDAAASA